MAGGVYYRGSDFHDPPKPKMEFVITPKMREVGGKRLQQLSREAARLDQAGMPMDAGEAAEDIFLAMAAAARTP